jgi:hypothetical protein
VGSLTLRQLLRRSRRQVRHHETAAVTAPSCPRKSAFAGEILGCKKMLEQQRQTPISNTRSSHQEKSVFGKSVCLCAFAFARSVELPQARP